MLMLEEGYCWKRMVGDEFGIGKELLEGELSVRRAFTILTKCFLFYFSQGRLEMGTR